MNRRSVKIFLLAAVGVFVACFFIFGLDRYFDFQFIKAQQEAFGAYYASHPLGTIAAYVTIYIAVTALSLPGAAALTLIGGALFGLATGTLIVSFCSTIGATLAFLVARFLLRDSIQSKFKDRLETINKGIEKDGVFYLFTMRLIPAIPFFVINLVMGLTPIRTVQFFFVSQLGMFPGTLVYVNAGTQLGEIESLAGILSPQLILSFALLGLFPLLAKKSIGFVNRRRAAKA